MRRYALEIGIAAAVVVLMGLSVLSTILNRKEFTQVCAKGGGEAVWDGRQYQCMNRTQQEPTR